MARVRHSTDQEPKVGRELSADPTHSQDFHPAILIVNLELHSQRPFDENSDVFIARLTLLVGIGSKESVNAVSRCCDRLSI